MKQFVHCALFIYLSVTYSKVIGWLQNHLLSCPSKKYLHIECPGCGVQRSVVALLKGDLAESLTLYPATIPMMLLAGFALLHLKYRFARGPAVIIFLQAAVALIIVVFYIYKIITHKITD